jgi:hypothetical protein
MHLTQSRRCLSGLTLIAGMSSYVLHPIRISPADEDSQSSGRSCFLTDDRGTITHNTGSLFSRVWGAPVTPGMITHTTQHNRRVVASLILFKRPGISKSCLDRFVQYNSYRVLQPSFCFPGGKDAPERRCVPITPRCQHVGSYFATLAVCSKRPEQKSKHRVHFLQSPCTRASDSLGSGTFLLQPRFGEAPPDPADWVPLTGKRSPPFGYYGICGVRILGIPVVKRGEVTSVGVLKQTCSGGASNTRLLGTKVRRLIRSNGNGTNCCCTVRCCGDVRHLHNDASLGV